MRPMIDRVRRALIELTPDYLLRHVLGPHVYRAHRMKRAELNEAAFEYWAVVEPTCFNWIDCAKEKQEP